MELIVSQFGFSFLIALFLIGAIGSLVLYRYDALVNAWSSAWAIAGSLWGMVFSASTLLSGKDLTFEYTGNSFPLLSISPHIDGLSALFLFVISLIALFCSLYGFGYARHFYTKYNLGALGFFYHAFIIGMLLSVSASNAMFFLIAWEVMSIASYFLVIYERAHAENVKAGVLYLTMTFLGTTAIMMAFLLLFMFVESFDFQVIRSSFSLIPEWIQHIVFILMFIGLGTKAGIIPFHIWLPAAHPAAPSYVSALMSGVMIKTGIYMMIRLFLDIFGSVSLWWGIALLVVGSISALLGVLYCLVESDIKKLLAYSSIENIGIILIGLGSTFVLVAIDMRVPALLAFSATLFHIANHAVFKSLLFLSAGAVISATKTRNMEEYGGIIKRMPYTAAFFFVGALSASAIPPLNGFFSEWMLFQSLFQGMFVADSVVKGIFVLATGALVFTSGLVLAVFVKTFGITFLARPRSVGADHAKDPSSFLTIGMGALAIISVLLGVFSGSILPFFEKIGMGIRAFGGALPMTSTSSPWALTVSGANGVNMVSGWVFALFLMSIFLFIIFFVRFVIYDKQKVKMTETWDCGVELGPRMEISATGFARSLILVFRGILRPSIQQDVEYHDAKSRYLSSSKTVVFSIQNIYNVYLYHPARMFLDMISVRAKKIQGGNINVYILYILVALVMTLFLAL